MKNIVNTALIAVTVLSLAACGDKTKKQGPDSTSTNVKIDSTTKTTTTIDSTAKDTSQKVSAQVSAPKSHSGSGSTSLRAVEDSIKKDSAKLSRK
jgi:predicted small lipoprotein YifL